MIRCRRMRPDYLSARVVPGYLDPASFAQHDSFIYSPLAVHRALRDMSFVFLRAEPPGFIPSCRRPGVWNIGPKRAGLRLRISFMSFNHLVIPAPCIPAAPPGRRRMHPPSRGEN
jgi:hypothetical protein